MADKRKLCFEIARGLREFGYPDCTTDMIEEAWDAYAEGKRGQELPHDVIGMFAERSFDEIAETRPEIFYLPTKEEG